MISTIRMLNSTSAFFKLFLHTSNSNPSQIAKTMGKVMGRSKKKKFCYDTVYPTTPETFSKGSITGGKSESFRRSAVLNKLFMRHITDLMATGQYASEIIGQGIEISRVKVSPDYKFLNVYWYTRGHLNDEEVKNVLNKNAGYLRHELSNLRVMGNVPTINFVKDKHYGSVAEVDKRLAIAEYGDDYVPLDAGIRLKTEFQFFTPLDDHIKEQIEKLDAEDINEFTLPLPQMTQNIFGVNHADITEKIKKARRQLSHSNTNENSNTDWARFKITQPVNEDPVSFESEKAQRDAFKEFLHRQQMLKFEAKKYKTYNPDLEYLKEELSQSSHVSLDIPLDKFDEEDYIIEEIDKDN